MIRAGQGGSFLPRVGGSRRARCVHTNQFHPGTLSVPGEDPLAGGQAGLQPREAVQPRGELQRGVTRAVLNRTCAAEAGGWRRPAAL